MRRALELLGDLGVETTSDLTPDLLDRVVAHLGGKTEKTIAGLLWQINAACNWAVRAGYLGSSPFLGRPDLVRKMRDVSAPKVRKPGPAPAKVKRALAELATRAGSDNLAHRLYAMAATVAYTGLLPYTVGTIRVEDVDFEARVIDVPHVDGVRRRPRLVPMPDELATILEGWLRSRGHHRGRVLDEKRVAEARRLEAGGSSLGELCERYGVNRSAMSHALRGRTWKHVPTEGEVPSPVGDSEWLFPNFNPAHSKGVAGPSYLNGRNASSYRMLKEAGQVAGIDNLTFMGLQSFHRDYIRPRVVMAWPHAAGTAEVEPDRGPEGRTILPPLIEPGAGKNVWVIMGLPMEPLKKPKQRLIKALYLAWRRGERLSSAQLELVNGDHGKHLSDLEDPKLFHPHWGAILDRPGERGKRGKRTGFKDPRVSTS